jgi:prepilin peptidase CpaA
MNLVAGAPWWLIAFLMLGLVAAAIEDALRLRVSNLTSAAVVAGALVAGVLQGLSPALWQNAAIFLGILALGTLAFGAGWLGGGDVKLLAALGLWVNLEGAMLLLAAVFLAGGVLALGSPILRAMPGVRFRTSAKDRRLPYAIAIAVGALIAFGLQLEHSHATLQADDFVRIS